MRASVLLLGPLLARQKKVRVSLPGGCAIGARPINYHLKGFEKMGAKIRLEKGYVVAEVKKLRGTDYRFPKRTVTGTENLMMAAVLAEGKTVLKNAAQEPEVVDLADYLCGAGAKILGAGTDTITIYGVKSLKETQHKIMSDRIEAGTFMVAAAVTRGDILIKGAQMAPLRALVDKLREVGCSIQVENGGIRCRMNRRSRGVDLSTSPFPGFPTDMQAQFMVLMTVANGKSIITENIFENRFMHISELNRMGAQIFVEGKSAIVEGVHRLDGARLMATDLRASASLVLAGLCAKGQTRISRVYHIDRGYEHLEKKLRALGAKIRRINERYPI
jgi:UDP-N-acetylglucosamine 1-carboxyvinyltransferase